MIADGTTLRTATFDDGQTYPAAWLPPPRRTISRCSRFRDRLTLQDAVLGDSAEVEPAAAKVLGHLSAPVLSLHRAGEVAGVGVRFRGYADERVRNRSGESLGDQLASRMPPGAGTRCSASGRRCRVSRRCSRGDPIQEVVTNVR
jgi:hypothetical protein